MMHQLPSRRDLLKAAAGMAGLAAIPARAHGPAMYMYIGTYTTAPRRGEGISIFRVDAEDGVLELVDVVRDVVNPSFLATDPMQRYLYAVNEIGNYEGQMSGSVTAYAIDRETGKLRFLNRQPTHGRTPAHVSVDPTGRFVFVANYSGRNIVSYPILADGRLGGALDVVEVSGPLGPHQRQDSPRPHMIVPDPSGGYVLVNDLGIDRTLIYKVGPGTGTMSLHGWADAEPGAGPRHLAFHPGGRWLYRINELNNTMTALEWVAASGELKTIHSLNTLPQGFAGPNTTAQVVVAPYGKYVYGSNRGHQSIVLYYMDAATGRMEVIAHEGTRGETPRNFNLDPRGDFLFAANQDTDNVTIFEVNRSDGKLTGVTKQLEVGSPVCVHFSTAPQGVESREGVTYWAFSNPITVLDGTPLGRTTIAWHAPNAREVEIRLGSPSGVLLGRFPNYGTAITERWIPNGMAFYLQDVSDGKPLTRDNTLGVLSIGVRTSTTG
jgi:6-phosphogluconolactonase